MDGEKKWMAKSSEMSAEGRWKGRIMDERSKEINRNKRTDQR